MIDRNKASFESSDILRIFPTFVWKAQLNADIHERIDKNIVEYLSKIRHDIATPQPDQYWQSGQSLHKRDEFLELVSYINEASATVLKYLKVGHDAFEITACWANVSPPGAGHQMHGHPNNLLSGVYYARVQEGADTINFHDPRAQSGILRPPVTELTAENTDQVVVKIGNGVLLVFPSWLQHSVDSNRSRDERISLSFNVMLSSFTEKLTQPLWEA